MIQRYSELKPKVLTSDGFLPNVEGSSESLIVFLSPINSKEIQYRIGIEKLIKKIPVDAGEIQITKSEYNGWRYLFVNKTGDILSAIQGVSQGKKNVISNIYTRPEDRNKGFANILLNQVKHDKKNLVVDSHMTQQGSKFFHYSQLKCAAISGEQANRRAIRIYGLTSDESSIGFMLYL